MTQKDIEQILEKLGKYKTTISFTHEYVYIWSVECRIDRYRNISVMSLRDTQVNALNDALKLLEKLTEIEKTTKIVVPDLSNQLNDKGYHREIVGDTQFSYKRINNKFYLCGINKKIGDGFNVLNTPVPIDNTYKFIEHTDKGDLYEWDDIQFLSGTAGLAYVKDGLVVASKIIRMS
jgi:hypothetical protein